MLRRGDSSPRIRSTLQDSRISTECIFCDRVSVFRAAYQGGAHGGAGYPPKGYGPGVGRGRCGLKPVARAGCGAGGCAGAGAGCAGAGAGVRAGAGGAGADGIAGAAGSAADGEGARCKRVLRRAAAPRTGGRGGASSSESIP